jgi:hypothetical protein
MAAARFRAPYTERPVKEKRAYRWPASDPGHANSGPGFRRPHLRPELRPWDREARRRSTP